MTFLPPLVPFCGLIDIEIAANLGGKKQKTHLEN